MSAGPERTEPAVPAPPTPPAPRPPAEPPVGPSMAAFGSNEACPNCGARMAADQRYCLTCGHRRGEPRLPFMDAVSFMESTSAPAVAAGGGAPLPPPPAASSDGSSRWNANAALIAGVATLVLAIGVGFLIGRSGRDNTTQAQAPIKVIEVGGGGSGETAAAATPAPTEASTGSTASSGKEASTPSAAKPKNKKPSDIKEGSKAEEERAAEKSAEVLHAEGPLAKPTAKVGESCEKGTPGCSSGGEFNGNFFGE